jgi:V/A-type H+-transporting ATPase subunit I
MFRPQRMTAVTLVCLQKDLDAILDTLNEFGQFHIEKTGDTRAESIGATFEEAERASAKLNSLIEQLKIKPESVSPFKYEETKRTRFSIGNWNLTLRNVSEEISALEEETNKAVKSLEEVDNEIVELQKITEVIRILERFDIDPRLLNELHLTYAIIASVPLRNMISLGRAVSDLPVVYHHKEISDNRAFTFLATTKKHSETVEKILKAYDMAPFPYLEKIDKKPSQALSDFRSRLDELHKKKDDTLRVIQREAGEYRTRIQVLKEIIWNIENTFKAKADAFKTERLAQISGFIPENSFINLEESLGETLGDHFILSLNHDVEPEDPPTALRNSFLVKPFEMITRLYGLPHYDEVDPTPVMAVTFPLIFGLMFGDLGHGLILFVGGLSLNFIIKSREGWRAFCKILAACGLGSILAGFLFGEAFGKQILTPLWLDPFNNVVTFLVFSLMVGAIQIMIGFVLNFINFVLKSEYIDALTVSLPKMILYVEALYFLLKYAVNFELWLSGPIFYLMATLLFLFLGKPVLFSVFKKGRFIPVLGERLFASSELLLSLISNTMSYARILALLMAHWALLTATYAVSDLVSMLPIVGQPVELIMIVGGNIAVMAFEGLIVFIHTLRLHFYEWFSKFYEGTGTAFQPFKYQEKYVEIKVPNLSRNR